MTSISYNEATAQSIPSRSKWARAQSRLVPDTRPLIRPSFSLPAGSSIFTIGSCFARNIEEQMAELGYSIPMLGFEVPRHEWDGHARDYLNRYTPASIYQLLEWTAKVIRNDGEITEETVEPFRLASGDSDSFIDLDFPGNTPVTGERFLSRRKEIFDVFKQAFSCETVTITLGLIETWYHRTRNIFLHHAPIGPEFVELRQGCEFRVLTFDQAEEFTRRSIDLILELNQKANFLITTSPIPLGRTFTNDDVITANSHSKSLLRAVCGQVSQAYPQVDYFPSYEQAMLTRSWSVWQEDRCHVSKPFVKSIVAGLVDAYCEPATSHDGRIAEAKRKFALEDFDATLAILDDLRSQSKFDEEVELLVARALIQNGDFKAAVDVLTRLVDQGMATAEVFSTLLVALDQTGDSDSCLRVASQFAESFPDKWQPFEKVAQYSLKTRTHHTEGLAAVDRAIELNRGMPPRLHNLRAKLLGLLCRYQHAAEAINQAIELNSENPLFYRTKLWLRDKQEQASLSDT